MSVWNPDSSYWEKPEFSVGILKEALIQSLGDRNTNSSRSSLNEKTASEIVKSGKDFFDVTNIFKQFELYKNQLMPMLHEALFKMSLIERDERWTIGVNKLMDTYSFSSTTNRVTINDKKDRYIYVWILCWMQSSSHPSVRNRLIRIIESFMENDQGLCLQMIDLFHNVNDSYILFGLYASVYGALLNSNDSGFTHEIAKLIYEKHFADNINVPSDINVRIWTLKILEYNNYLNPTDEFWEQSQPPYVRTVNLMDYPRNEDFDSNEYFGTGEGAKKIHHSLFVWDFNRYIIGTNSTNDSHTFIKNGNKVKLDDITKAVAYRIKSTIGYSDELSIYDTTVPWEERSYRRTERIGKKYQWIALGEVKAYLSDTCQMTKDWFNDEIAEKPYPWYADRITHFDPTLHISNNHITIDNELFDYLDKEDLFKSEGKDWIDSRVELPSQHIIIKDKNKIEWVVLVGYQKNNQTLDNDKRESFIYYSPCLVKNETDNIERFREWASKQNYYGRWMPESTGNYDYLWNEYPWADSYKQSATGEIEIWRNGSPCLVTLPYSAQLQEDREGINDEEDVNSTVYMPHADMYKMFNLRNAERGVVRDKDGEIIAINRNIPGDTLDALVIRRDYLNRFLEEKGYSLFYCNLAEKQLWNDTTLLTMQRLSSCYEYHPKNHVIELQPMTDERDFPKEPEPEEHGLDGFDIENWLTL